MKIERIKKNHKKEILIGGLIAICLISAITLTTSRAKYKLTDDIELAKGTINYKPYDFKVMAMYQSEDGTNYTEINEMPSNGYKINEEKSYCTTDNKTEVKGKLKTENGVHNFYNLKKSDKCYIYFDKIKITNSSDIIANSKINIGTPDFSKIATTDEGIYQASDGMYGGVSYYWRGSATTNYLKFANFCWRIVRINGDGSIRLIYDGTTCHQNGEATTDSIAVSNVPYNISYNNSSYVGWTYVEGKQRPEEGDTEVDSNAKIKTEEWYDSNIGNNATYASYVANGKYCNDRNAKRGDTWVAYGNTFFYAANERLNTLKTPSLACSEDDIYTLKVGAITADEAMLAGGNTINNEKYYLYNGIVYWTMTPNYWWYAGEVLMFGISQFGYSLPLHIYSSLNIRPVINLKSDVTFSSGDGTLNNPYIVQ